MFTFFKKLFTSNSVKRGNEIAPEDIFLDAHNLPAFDTEQFEGRLEHPISLRSIALLGMTFLLVGGIFVFQLWSLQVKQGEAYAIRSADNRLDHTIIFPERGVIHDRNGVQLAWNVSSLGRSPSGSSTVQHEEFDFARRRYATTTGLGHTLGYLGYPAKDSSGNYYETEYEGKAGIEKTFNSVLNGKVGTKITETNVFNRVQSEATIEQPTDGTDVTLSIDAELQHKLFTEIKATAQRVDFEGGAGVIMDVDSGEILALASVPEYQPEFITNASTTEALTRYENNPRSPFLNRAIAGVYAPGSIVKPFMAVAALEEDVIDPEKEILSTGSISLPNPYFPGKFSVFKDWKAHGWVDMREALAVSSDVYFYEIGGGYKSQEGLGITKIKEYMNLFGFGKKTGVNFPGESEGVVPDPAWKRRNFDNEEWNIGNTYHTSIGQYGFQVTPLQAVRAVSSIANGGTLVTPTFIKDKQTQEKKLPFEDESLQVVKEGMRKGVFTGTASGLNVGFLPVAAKTGTAELGVKKRKVNSWVIGFFPYDDPQYAFAVVMEKGPVENHIGGVYVMRQLFEWMNIKDSPYLPLKSGN